MSESLALAWQLLVQADATVMAVAWRSLQVSAWATLLACVLGVPLGAWLALLRSRAKPVLAALLGTYVAVPAVVVGLVVYVLLSRSGPLGFLGWLYSVKAMVLAQTLLVLPLAAMLAMQIVHQSQQVVGERLLSMGASLPWRVLLLLHHERRAWATVAITCFGRAIAEVGTVMMVGGNIEGFTRVLTTAVALETSQGNLAMAMALGVVLLGLVLALQLVLLALKAWPLGATPSLRGPAA